MNLAVLRVKAVAAAGANAEIAEAIAMTYRRSAQTYRKLAATTLSRNRAERFLDHAGRLDVLVDRELRDAEWFQSLAHAMSTPPPSSRSRR